MIEGPPLPDLDADSAPFWAAAVRGELAIQACGSCGRLRFPPRPMCPHCRSLAVAWRVLSGRGRVWSWVVPHPPLLPAFAPFAPYNVITVELEEDHGIRIVGNLVAAAGARIDSVDPASLRIGEPVRVAFERVADDVALPRWVREER